MNRFFILSKIKLIACFLLLAVLTPSLQAQNASSSNTIEIEISMTDTDGATTIKKIQLTGEDAENVDVEALVAEEIGDFKGEVEVDVSIEKTENIPSNELKEGEQKMLFIESESDDINSIQVEDMEITIEGDKIFMNGEEIKEGEHDGMDVIVLEMDGEEGKQELDDLLESMDIDMDDLLGGEKGEARKQIRIMKKELHSEEHTGKGGFMGVHVMATEDGTGVKITHVMKGSAAKKAGLKENDIINNINDEAITSHESLVKAVSAFAPNESVQVGYIRNETAQTTALTLGERKAHKKRHFKNKQKRKACNPSSCCPPNCCEISDTTPFLGVIIDETPDKKGVLVLNINEGSPADKIDLESGDIIYKINKEAVNTTEELIDAIGDMEVGDKVKVRYWRDGKKEKAKTILVSTASMMKNGACCQGQQGCNKTSATENKHIIIKKIILDDNGEQQIIEEVIEADKMPNFGGNNTLKLESIQLFPNPTKGNVNVNFTTAEKAATIVSIVDLAGKEIYTKNIQNFKGKFDEKIDLSGKDKGIYFLNIKQGDKVFIEKLIVQ